VNVAIPLYVNEAPTGLIHSRVAAAYSFADAIRSAYLTRCCKQDFKKEDARAEWIEKAKMTRQRNAEIRRQMITSATVVRAP
jgi:hypothetical protein